MGNREWGVGNEDEVAGVSISSVSNVFNSKASCTEIRLRVAYAREHQYISNMA